jgi:WD40 repeat protein
MTRRTLAILVLFALLYSNVLTTAPRISAQGNDQFAPITTRNAARVALQRTLGLGTLDSMQWSADGKTYYLATAAGLWHIDPASPDRPPLSLDVEGTNLGQLTLSEDEQWVATTTGGEGSRVRLLHRQSAEAWEAFNDPKGQWLRLLFSPSGHLLALNTTRRLWLYDLQKRRVVFTLDDVIDFTVAPDGKSFAAFVGQRIQEWDITTRQEIARYRPLFDSIGELGFSSDGKTLYAVRRNQTLYALDTTTRQLKYELPLPISTRIVYDRTVSTAVSWRGRRKNGFAHVIDLTQGRVTVTLQATETISETEPIVNVALSPDGSRAATFSFDGLLRVWDTRSGQKLAERTIRSTNFLCFDPAGTRLAMRQGNALMFYDYATDTMSAQPGFFGASPSDVMFSPDGKLLATADRDGRLNVWAVDDWALQSSRRITTFSANSYGLAFSPDSRTLVVAAQDGTWRFDLAAEATVASTSLWNGPCYSIAYSPDGKSMVCRAEQTVMLLDPRAGALLWDFAQAAGIVSDFSSVAYTPDASALYLLTPHNELWRLDLTPALRPTTRPVNVTGTAARNGLLVFSPDGTLVANYGADNVLRLWDAQTGQERHQWRSQRERTEPLRGSWAAFSPDGALLAAVFDNRELRLYDTTSGERLLATTSGTPPFALNKVAFSPDGTQIVVTARNGVLLLYAVQS